MTVPEKSCGIVSIFLYWLLNLYFVFFSLRYDCRAFEFQICPSKATKLWLSYYLCMVNKKKCIYDFLEKIRRKEKKKLSQLRFELEVLIIFSAPITITLTHARKKQNKNVTYNLSMNHLWWRFVMSNCEYNIFYNYF